MEQKGSPVELGTGNIRQLLLKYAIPSVIAMTAASLYNITDSIFIGQGVGALAISGLAITFPLMNLSAAFGSLVGVGASTLMSLRLGQKDYSTANNILGNVFVLNLILGLAYTILVLLFLDPILRFFGASSETLPYSHDFMVIISLGNVITHLYFGLNAMLRATGHPYKSMYATIFSVVINVALAPVFIFVFRWGIRGAALATVIAQTSMLLWQISHFTNKNNFIHLQKGSLRLKRKIVIDSLSIGTAPFLMNSVASIIVILINTSLIRYGGDLAVGAYGIINRIAFLFMMVVIGFNQGMQPIAGYNFGARQYNRVNHVLKLTIILATSVVTAGFIIGELFPRTVASIFTREKELIEIVVPGMRIIFMVFPIVGFQMVTSNFFQSIGMPGKAIFMSLSRQVIFLLPFLLILPHIYGVNGVWLSMPASDFMASMVAAYLLVKQYRKYNVIN
ncbi:MAG TPA: MATE family efflux transporter [Bacteroidales bacterium]|nr:MATE family efflux transporter [Bacteroidales bacterium]HOX73876.1 MATE family efflux transporter [Bacteroidales bacterium]HPM87230.1 MATE family efflux transporter [Bacteroidales bacterium]HQM69195.1 MATE family efflux transporter [Bacteroidales bacterium]